MQFRLNLPRWVTRYFFWLFPKKFLGLYQFQDIQSVDTDHPWLHLHRMVRLVDQEMIHLCAWCEVCGGQVDIESPEQLDIWTGFHENCGNLEETQCV